MHVGSFISFTTVLSFGKAQKIRLVMQDYTPHNPTIVKHSEILEKEFYKATGIEIDLELVRFKRNLFAELNLLI